MNIKLRSNFSLKALALPFLLFVAYAGEMECANGTQIISQLPPPGNAAVGGGDSYASCVSPDGRYLLFASTANNLVAASNGHAMPDYVPARVNVFLRDRQAAITTLISINAAGTGGGNGNSWPSALSTDGRFALFQSDASDLVAGDTNKATDIFLRDVLSGTTLLVSVSTNGSAANGPSREASMTPDGRYVAFVSAASNLVAGDSNLIADIFVRDIQAGTTVLASPGAQPIPPAQIAPFTAPSSSEYPIISADGRYVAFYSTATNLVSSGPTFGEVYVRDLVQGVTFWASTNAHLLIASPASANYAISTNGQFVAYQTESAASSQSTPGGGVFRYNVATGATDIVCTNGSVADSLDLEARNIDISADGRFVVFTALDVPRNSPGITNSIKLWDALSNTISIVSGGAANAQCDSPRLDQTGRYVAFLDNESLTTNSDGNYHIFVRDTATGLVQLADVGINGSSPISHVMMPYFFSDSGNLVAFHCLDGAMSSSPTKYDVFARDLAANATAVISTPVSTLPSGTAFGSSGLSPFSISSNGQFVAFYSDAAGLAPSVTNGYRNIYRHDLASGLNVLVSVGTDGLTSGSSQSFDPSISGDGRFVAFASSATNLVANDTNNAKDVFVRDVQTGLTVLVSVDASGLGEGNGDSYSPQISSNGRYVLFFSAANNLVAGASAEFFWRDLQAGTTTAIGATNIATMTPDGSKVLFVLGSQLCLWQAQTKTVTTNVTLSATTPIWVVAISPDGTRAVFEAGGQNYTVDLVQNTYAPLSAGPAFQSLFPGQFSGNGLFLANLVGTLLPPPSNNIVNYQVYLYSFEGATNQLISQAYDSSGPGNGTCDSLAISEDGRYVAYRSSASNLVPDDANGLPDVFLYDRLTGGTTLISVSQFGARSANGHSGNPVFSGDGQTLFFQSWASDLAPGDFNQAGDVFALSLSTNGLGGLTNVPPSLEFSGLVMPAAGSQNGTNQGPTLLWQAIPGVGYQVQFKNSLTDPEWEALPVAATVVGAQGQIIDLTPNREQQRFYRLISF
ncbi:MAG: hypothetical protein ACLQVY_29670 [Limisphaerales bacterium]